VQNVSSALGERSFEYPNVSSAVQDECLESGMCLLKMRRLIRVSESVLLPAKCLFFIREPHSQVLGEEFYNPESL
jgi:hypothetical protein